MSAKTEDDIAASGDILSAEGLAWPEAEFDLVLRRPITVGEDTVDRLQLHEPDGGQWEDIMAHSVATRRRYAVSRVSGVPMAACKQIGIGDLVRAEEYLNSFFEVGRAIGAS
jgi:hypothetical protein